MLIYFTLSYLLFIPGMLVYSFLVKPKGTPKRRRDFLYFTVAMSLLLPALFLYFSPNFFDLNRNSYTTSVAEQSTDSYAYELELCYNKAVNETDFCQCDDLQQTSLVLYKRSNIYETAINYKSFVQMIFIALSAMVFVWLVWRCVFLLRLIHRSKKEIRYVDGKAYHILFDEKNEILAASFRLWKRYIVWRPILDELPEDEQQAILYHEIAHIENKDTWQQIGVSALQIFWFLNPLFYTLRRELHLLNEFLADAFAAAKTGNQKTYASLLIRLKEQQQFGLLQLFGAQPFKSRILQLAHPNKTSGKNPLPIIIVLTGMFLIGFASTPLLTGQSKAFFEYELVHHEHLKTGKTYFCKTCLYKQAGKECEE